MKRAQIGARLYLRTCRYLAKSPKVGPDYVRTFTAACKRARELDNESFAAILQALAVEFLVTHGYPQSVD